MRFGVGFGSGGGGLEERGDWREGWKGGGMRGLEEGMMDVFWREGGIG